MSTRRRSDLLLVSVIIAAAVIASTQLRSFAGPQRDSDTFLHGQWEVSPEAPILRSGENRIDWYGAADPHVIRHKGRFFMYYTCAGTTEKEPDRPRTRICLATSQDGFSWERHGDNPILEPADDPAWDSLGLETPFVLPDGAGFKLYYMGYDIDDGSRWLAGDGTTLGSIGLAMSGNGIHFNRVSEEPILAPNKGTGPRRHGAWDSWSVEGPSVIKNGRRYFMYYGGLGSLDGTVETDAIGLAISSDGISWERRGSVPQLLATHDAWDRYHVVDPFVLVHRGQFLLWYHGARTIEDDAYTDFQVGLATSGQGTRWRRSAHNPVLASGSKGAWHQSGVLAPSVLARGNASGLMYFHSDDGPGPSIGRAVLTQP